MLAFSLTIVIVALLAVVQAQQSTRRFYQPQGCVDTAYSDNDCFYYSYDNAQRDSGFGYMFYNPYVCNGEHGNMVGCTGMLNFTTYLNYYVATNNAVPGSAAFAYVQQLQNTFQRFGFFSNFNQHYCVRNCMFCKLLDTLTPQSVNFDPFCPAEVCTRFNLDPSRCLQRIVDPRTAGIGVKQLTPALTTTWDIDTEYDIVFSVFGVSNSVPYMGMPLNTATEGCPVSSTTRGLDGMPTGFTFQPDYQWIKQNLNRFTIL
eukprot:gene43479-53159_t